VSYLDANKGEEAIKLINLQTYNTFKTIIWSCLDEDSRKEPDSENQHIDLTILEHHINEIQINIDVRLYIESISDDHTAFLLEDTTWEGDLSFFSACR
jgi:hypothetical protein